MVGNQYYLKDKKLSLWTYTTEYVLGVAKKSYKKTYSLIWAYYRHNGGTAGYSNSNGLTVYDENASAIFVINRVPVEKTMLIVFNHKIYEITRIDDYEGYLGDIKLLAKLADNQSFSSYTGLEDDV